MAGSLRYQAWNQNELKPASCSTVVYGSRAGERLPPAAAQGRSEGVGRGLGSIDGLWSENELGEVCSVLGFVSAERERMISDDYFLFLQLCYGVVNGKRTGHTEL